MPGLFLSYSFLLLGSKKHCRISELGMRAGQSRGGVWFAGLTGTVLLPSLSLFMESDLWWESWSSGVYRRVTWRQGAFKSGPITMATWQPFLICYLLECFRLLVAGLPLALKVKKYIISHNEKSRGRTGSQNSEISHSVMSPRSQVLSTLGPAFLNVGFIPRLAPFLVTRWLPEATELPASFSTFGRISILFSLSRPVVSILLYIKITRSVFELFMY